jgi:hypothetical protein
MAIVVGAVLASVGARTLRPRPEIQVENGASDRGTNRAPRRRHRDGDGGQDR